MTPRMFCQSGEAEMIKGVVHGVACALTAVMAAYNIVAWCVRRERHLLCNALVYTPATYFEWRQTMRHLRHVREMGDGQ